MFNKIYKKGIGLLELMISLVIITSLILMALRYFPVVGNMYRVSKAVDMVQLIRSAGQRYLLTHADYTEVKNNTVFEDRNLIPKGFNKNPWGGDLTIASSGINLTISMSKISQGGCNSLLNQITGISCEVTKPGCDKDEDLYKFSVTLVPICSS